MDMDKPRDAHTKWSQLDRERQILWWYHLYMESNNSTNELTNRSKHGHKKHVLQLPKGKRRVGINWENGMNRYTLCVCVWGGMCVGVLVTQSFLTLCKPMDSSLPDSSVHGILQATIQEWAAIPFQGFVPIQGSNLSLLQCRWIL